MNTTTVTLTGDIAYGASHDGFEVRIAGRLAAPFKPIDAGCRLLFVDCLDSPTKIVKIDEADFCQSVPEFELYTTMDEEDREFFTPTHEAGWLGDLTGWALADFVSGWTDWSGDFAMAPRSSASYPSLDRYLPLPDHREAWATVTRLTRKYDLNDMAPRQVKFKDGQPIIHDFGLNPFSSDWSPAAVG